MASITEYRRSHPLKAWFKGIKDRAREKGLEFDLELADLAIPERCPVLGIPLESSMGTRTRRGGARDNSPSLDRIDNSKGYVRGNVVVVSFRANRFKSDANLEELRKIVAFYDALTLSGNSSDWNKPIKAEEGRKSDAVSEMLTFAPEEVGSLFVGARQ